MRALLLALALVLTGCVAKEKTEEMDMPTGWKYYRSYGMVVTVAPVDMNGTPCVVAFGTHGAGIDCDWRRR